MVSGEMLLQQRGGFERGLSAVERETYHRVELCLRHLSSQTVHRSFKTPKVRGQQLLRLLAGDGLAATDIGTGMANADGPNVRGAKVGGETFALEFGDKRPSCGAGFQSFIGLFIRLLSARSLCHG